jgi:hypothetical protein
MNRVDRIARLGWFATAMLGLATATGCAATTQGVPVSTTTTTAAEIGSTGVDPGGEQLPMAPRPSAAKCGGDLRQNVDFVPRSTTIDRADMPDIDRWAACLQVPEMEHTTVVLVGGQAASEPEGFFVTRAARIRDALVARGVDSSRIVIGATNASREGGPVVGNTGVRIEVTHRQQVRGFVPADTGVRAVIH